MAKATGMTQAEQRHFRHHGGRLNAAMRAYPHAPTPWLDLSTGINPRPWSPPEALAVDSGPLPSVDALAKLEEAAARFFGAPPERFAAVPGSELALRLLGVLGLPAPIVACEPSYGTHRDIADQSVPINQLQSASGRQATLLVANPNNPDGHSLSPAEMLQVAARQRADGGWLVVDEAFADATPDLSVVPYLKGEEPVIVTRSFGKFFGLAGLRLGFFIAPPAVVARLRHIFGDWPVSAQAIAWGTAAYSDAAWIARARRELPQAAAELDAVLARHGLLATGSSPLFRLVETPQAPTLFDRLAHAGILTRPFADHPDWLRIGLPADADACDRLHRALSGG